MLSIRTSLPAVSPVQPDFHICDQRYGVNVDPVDCNVAGGELPVGASEVPYAVNTAGAALALPVSIKHGNLTFGRRLDDGFKMICPRYLHDLSRSRRTGAHPYLYCCSERYPGC